MRIWKTLIVLTGALVVGTASAARLKEQPPEGVSLKGTWRLDPARSDDPAEKIERAVQSERSQRQRQMEERTRRGPWDDEDEWDRRRNRMPGEDRYERDPFPDLPSRRGGSTDIDPLGRGGSVTWSSGMPNAALQNEFLLQLDPNPGTLTIQDWGKRVSVFEDKLETDCTAGETTPMADAFGEGERRCGWSGRTWVIETKRPKRFTRTDRFELSKDGKTLLYTTSASGPRISSIKISRTYERVTSPPPQ